MPFPLMFIAPLPLVRHGRRAGVQPAAFGLMKEKFLEIGDRD
jgi:hypothetical protein